MERFIVHSDGPGKTLIDLNFVLQDDCEVPCEDTILLLSKIKNQAFISPRGVQGQRKPWSLGQGGACPAPDFVYQYPYIRTN